MRKHTPEPWSKHMLGGGKGGPNRYSIRGAGDDGSAKFAVATTYGGPEGLGGHNAARIVACVNALAGIDVTALQSRFQAFNNLFSAATALRSLTDGENVMPSPEWWQQLDASLSEVYIAMKDK